MQVNRIFNSYGSFCFMLQFTSTADHGVKMPATNKTAPILLDGGCAKTVNSTLWRLYS